VRVRTFRRSRLYINMKITLESNCPRCGSRNIRRSRHDSVLVRTLRYCLLDPYRCRSCFRRFFRPRVAVAAARELNGTAAS